MSTITHDIVAKLWNLCNVLKDDGVTYHQYVTELTYRLFLKMAKETSAEEQIPPGCRGTIWNARIPQSDVLYSGQGAVKQQPVLLLILHAQQDLHQRRFACTVGDPITRRSPPVPPQTKCL